MLISFINLSGKVYTTILEWKMQMSSKLLMSHSKVVAQDGFRLGSGK